MARIRLLTLALAALLLVGGGILLRREEARPAPRREAPRAAGAPAEARALKEVPPEVGELLRDGRSWRAARLLRDYLERRPDAPPEVVLLAARTEAGWGGWERVREYLEGRPWLDRAESGEGWYWLGRSLESEREWEPAANAYARYLERDRRPEAEDRRVVAELRQGLLLLRLGRVEEGTALLEGTRARSPEIVPRVELLAAEALATRGDTARVRALTARPGVAALQPRAQRALLAAYEKSGDQQGTRSLALALRGGAASAAARAEFSLVAARMALALGDRAAGQAELRAALAASPGSGAARDAATLLAATPPLSPEDQLTLGGIFARHGNHSRAATAYRAWLAAGVGNAAERDAVRLRLGRALFGAGSFAAAEAALAPLASAAGELGAEALYLTGRAELRRGNAKRAEATLLRLAQRHPRTEQGAEGLFLVADAHHDEGELARAEPLYRRVAGEFPGTDRAGLSLMRLGGTAFVRRDYAGAARAWEEYRASYPRGERWLESTYWAGRANEARGDTAAARSRYRAVREREPLSYYALLAARRLGADYWPIPLDPAPPEDAQARGRVEEWMHGVDLLREAGLYPEAEAEADRRVAQAGDDPALLYPLAEVLNRRGYTVRGVRIGNRLERREARPNERLLRILYPFPYRAMMEAEARERGLDPFLVAALTRQESLFKDRITSPVGARGLMQIMPATGKTLAPSVGIRQWDPELLYQPEINVHLGTLFLREQMREQEGSLPAVFAAYNAGPSRVDRWEEFPEFRDAELFTERIPYRETRDYVKILTRNIALYRGLYGTAP